MSKKILILGASSDIGVETVKYFLKKNWYVTAHFNKNKNKLSQIKSKKLKLIKFDLVKIKSFEKFIKKNSNEISNFDAFISLTGYMKLKKFHKILPDDLFNHINANYISNLLIIQKLMDYTCKLFLIFLTYFIIFGYIYIIDSGSCLICASGERCAIHRAIHACACCYQHSVLSTECWYVICICV